ncbi:MAG: Ig-like domain-containing protein [Clostridia bacterium]|nr:Ig-like domain-containing protein [Clostridia bacterium]MBQ6177853.1 Ig-like domain-containing protein [Bacteroidales bacterium]
MKRVVCLILAGILLILAVPCALADSMVEVTKGASIRADAGYNGEKVRLAQPGERFEYLGEQGTWYKIGFDGGSVGYLPKDCCKLIASQDGEPSDARQKDATVRITRIAIQDRNVTIAPETRWALAYTLTPVSASPDNVTWTSSNEAVATVDRYGVVTGIAKGSAKITATAADNSRVNASINIKVDDFDMVFTSAEKKTAVYHYGSGLFVVKAKSKSGCVSVPETITSMIAMVVGGYASDTFSVTPVKAGTDVITVTAGRVKTTIKVYVSPEAFKPIEVHEEATHSGSDSSKTVTESNKKNAEQLLDKTVLFGHYPQTEEGADNTPIEWTILDIDEENHRALLISKYALDCQPYNDEFVEVTWEDCTLRAWLNNDFLDTAFSESEQSAILLSTVDNSSNQGSSDYKTTGGNNTEDKIFLLSYSEAWHYYFENDDRRCAPTNYAISQNAYIHYNETINKKPVGIWWLRSPGYSLFSAIYVSRSGASNNDHVNSDQIAVRPVFWVDLDTINH